MEKYMQVLVEFFNLLRLNIKTMIPLLSENCSKMSDLFLLTLTLLRKNLKYKSIVDERNNRKHSKKSLKKSLVDTLLMFILSNKVIFLRIDRTNRKIWLLTIANKQWTKKALEWVQRTTLKILKLMIKKRKELKVSKKQQLIKIMLHQWEIR